MISHNYAKIKVDSYDCLPLEKPMTFCDVIILINWDFIGDINNFYYNIFLKKGSYESHKKLFCIKYKQDIIIELTLLKDLMLIRQANQKSDIYRC